MGNVWDLGRHYTLVNFLYKLDTRCRGEYDFLNGVNERIVNLGGCAHGKLRRGRCAEPGNERPYLVDRAAKQFPIFFSRVRQASWDAHERRKGTAEVVA